MRKFLLIVGTLIILALGGLEVIAAPNLAVTEERSEASAGLDDDVGPEPAPVHAERCDRAVGRDEQREHVEPLASVVARESRVGAGRLSYGDGRLFRRPRPAVEPRLAVRAERRVEREQPRMGPRGDHPAALVTHVDDPIADDPVDRELGALETLAGERLHRKAPELGDAHHRLPDVETRRNRGGIQWIGRATSSIGWSSWRMPSSTSRSYSLRVPRRVRTSRVLMVSTPAARRP